MVLDRIPGLWFHIDISTDVGKVISMESYYTTIGDVFRYAADKYRETGRLSAFPAVLAEMYRLGLVTTEAPPIPPFYAGMSRESFLEFLHGMQIRANELVARDCGRVQDTGLDEAAIFPDGKDVFCVVNLPYMSDYSHHHSFFEITYLVQGACTLHFEGETAELSEGDLCIISPMSAHSVPSGPNCVSLSILVRTSTFDTAFGNMLTKGDLLGVFFRSSLYENRRANYLLLKTQNDPMVLSTVEQLAYECNLTTGDANACAVNLLNILLIRALRAANAVITLHHYEGYSERDFDFTLILQYIQKNYQTVTLFSLAETFQFSETYLSKLIRKKMNQSFTEVLRTLKMNHAVGYLTNTSLKISEIAVAVGYDSVDHFTRTFRKTYGVTPQAYRHLQQAAPKKDG